MNTGSGDIPSFEINPTWQLTKEALMKIPSIYIDGMSPAEELKQRQKGGLFMQQMGDLLINGVKEHRVKMSFCMCVAMIHFHRFFIVHSMKIFDPRDIAAACLFLAGKSEEFPRKLELVAKTWYKLKHRNDEHVRPFDQKICEESAEYIVYLESIILQTIGFKLDVQLPHPLIVRYTQKYIRDKVNLNETAYFFATDMLFITNWCVRYRISTLACICIHLTCLWADYEILQPSGSVPWYKDIDPQLTKEVLDELVDKFTKIYETTDQTQLISRKRMAERQNRMLASTSRYTCKATSSGAAALPPNPNPAPASSSTSGNSAMTYHNSANTTSNNTDGLLHSADHRIAATSSDLSGSPAADTTASSDGGKLSFLPPPPMPPQLMGVKREMSEDKDTHPSDRPPEIKQRKMLTIKEYQERNAKTSSTSVNALPRLPPDTIRETIKREVTNATGGWMNGV